MKEQEQLTYLLHRVNHDFSDWMGKIFDQFQISQPAVLIIRYIKYYPGTTISEIARNLEFAKSHVSKVIVHFEQEEMVEKRSDPTDQRILKLYLTDAGDRFLQEMRVAMRKRVQEVVEILPENRLDLLIEGLQDLDQALKIVKEKDYLNGK